jgi:hypothetical protein
VRERVGTFEWRPLGFRRSEALSAAAEGRADSKHIGRELVFRSCGKSAAIPPGGKLVASLRTVPDSAARPRCVPTG